jgi:hypothetical protein
MYAEYMVHAVAFHYVTATTTATPGSILMYVGKDRAGPGVITSSANLLPFILSDQETVISPVWQNCSSVFRPVPQWYTTGLGNDEGLHEQACGEFFIFDKSDSANTPGYVIMDYDISFRVMQVNIKSLTFPMTRMKYTQMVFGLNTSITQGGNGNMTTNAGVLLDAATQSATPTGSVIGDVFKVILNVTNSSFSGANNGNLFQVGTGNSQTTTVTLLDGFTMYAVYDATNQMVLFPTYEGAITNSNPMQYGHTGATVVSLYAYLSYVGSVGNSTFQASY